MRRVVITGLGAVSPLGNDIPTLWAGIKAGKNGVAPITKFDSSDFKVHLAAEVKDFDPLEYIEKSEVRKIDLYAQYALAAAHQAMADSDIEGKIDPTRFGVYIGSGIGGISTIMTEHQKLLDKGPRGISPHFIHMNIMNMAAGRVAIRYGLKGPTLPVVTACATSTNAVGEAMRAIRHGYADAIVAGGSEAAVNGLCVGGFINCMALSANPDPETACRPFDKNRDGFILGEGAAILILEEYEHAISRGAKIYAEVVGYGNTCDAHHVTAPDPEAEGSARAFREAIKEANLTAEDVIYINAHGTSTPLNDKTETKAIKKAFGEETAHKAYVSSTKSMTGHMLGGAGAIEAVISALAVKEGVIPPTIHYETPDEECDLNYVPNQAIRVQPTVVFSSSLGFGGHNAVIALRKA